MKNSTAYLRAVFLLIIAYLLIEYTVEVDKGSVFMTHPWAWAALLIAGVAILAIEFSVGALRNVLYRSLNRDEKVNYLRAKKEREDKQFGWFKRIYKKMLDKKPIEKEDEIILDHNYDGIRELDNNLPPWWLYMFYASILFAVVYMARYHIFNGADQIDEYEKEVAQAKIDIEEYKKTAKNLVDVNTVEKLTDESDLAAGQAIFENDCAACHKADGGGGIGPNLTDDYWILGGGIKNVFKTISEGGRSGKGMVAWKGTLSPMERAQVSSYVLSLQGTDPANPKEPEGDLWEEGDE